MVATLLIAIVLTSCKSGGKTATFDAAQANTTTSATIVENGGTTVDGEPIIDDGDISIDGSSPVAKPVGGTTSVLPKTATTLRPADLVKPTGTTVVETTPGTDSLSMPKAGRYVFRDTTTGPDHEADFHYDISVNGPVVRLQQSELATTGPGSYYEETHTGDGLFLTNSVITGGSCMWSPPAASLPQSVIDGGTASTVSHCATKVGGKDYAFDLTVDLAFKRIRTVSINGTEYRCVDVTRRRVLKAGTLTETVDATDTYAFKLGLRIEVTEKVNRKDGQDAKTYTHKSVLTALP